MATCEKCGTQVDNHEVYSVKEQQMCEECMIKYQSPSRPCGGGPGSAQPS